MYHLGERVLDRDGCLTVLVVPDMLVATAAQNLPLDLTRLVSALLLDLLVVVIVSSHILSNGRIV